MAGHLDMSWKKMFISECYDSVILDIKIPGLYVYHF